MPDTHDPLILWALTWHVLSKKVSSTVKETV
jgi:hypothetical protein